MKLLVWDSRLCYYTSMGQQWTMNDEGRAKISAYAKKRYEGRTVEVICKNCPNKYVVSKSRLEQGRGKFCSKSCKIEASKGTRPSKGTEFKKGQKPWNAGIEYLAVKGSKNAGWKGDDVGYSGLHKFVKRQYEWETACTRCYETKGFMDLANMTGIYNREKENWAILCRKCHIKEDKANPKKPPFEMRAGW